MDNFDYLAADPLSSPAQEDHAPSVNPTAHEPLAADPMAPDPQAQMLGRILTHISDYFSLENPEDTSPLPILRLLKSYHLLKVDTHTMQFQEHSVLAENHHRRAELHKRQADSHNLHAKRITQSIEIREKDLLWRDTNPEELVVDGHPSSAGVASPEAWVPKKKVKKKF